MNDIEKVVKIGILFDFYGELLTVKQKKVVSLYYDEDYSLGEISELLKISRQAVYDTVKRAEKILISYEEKLNLIEKFESRDKYIRRIFKGIKKVQNSIQTDKGNALDELENLKDVCKELLK